MLAGQNLEGVKLCDTGIECAMRDILLAKIHDEFQSSNSSGFNT